jgi:hypothetical protein
MNKLRPLLFIVMVVALFSCEKEYSNENTDAGNDLIVGIDCRISKIVYTDTSGQAAIGHGSGLGFIEADINNLDIVTGILQYDSVGNTIVYISPGPVYTNDTVYINPDEYFVVDVNKRINKMHGLIDPTDPFSVQYDVFYAYNTGGYLATKNYFYTANPTISFLKVDYTYAGANLTHMSAVNLPAGDLDMDADITYFNNIVPQRFIYIFPDERFYPEYNQFFNFGNKNFNAPKNMKVRSYDPGNVLRDSSVSTFSNYIMSRDSYVFSVQMGGNDQPSIPALAGKLSFSYHCR